MAAILWEDGTDLLWEDGTAILWEEVVVTDPGDGGEGEPPPPIYPQFIDEDGTGFVDEDGTTPLVDEDQSPLADTVGPISVYGGMSTINCYHYRVWTS
jgi:hypothetical protein